MRNRSSSELSRRTVDGGIQPSGSHGDKYASPNVIRFPALEPPAPANSELRSRAPFFFSDDACALCAMSIFAIGFITAICLLLFAGFEIFDLFDLG